MWWNYKDNGKYTYAWWVVENEKALYAGNEAWYESIVQSTNNTTLTKDEMIARAFRAKNIAIQMWWNENWPATEKYRREIVANKSKSQHFFFKKFLKIK